MSIRLNKALRELNIGLQTAVEFLEKKSELGEVKAEPSFKLSDEQYNALVKAFQQDKEVRSQAEKLLQKKPKEKKRAVEPADHKAETVLNANKQQFKPLGKIDLGSIEGKSTDKRSDAKETPKTAEKTTEATAVGAAKTEATVSAKAKVEEKAAQAEVKPEKKKTESATPEKKETAPEKKTTGVSKKEKTGVTEPIAAEPVVEKVQE